MDTRVAIVALPFLAAVSFLYFINRIRFKKSKIKEDNLYNTISKEQQIILLRMKKLL